MEQKIVLKKDKKNVLSTKNVLKLLEDPKPERIDISEFFTKFESEFETFLSQLNKVKDSFFIFNHSHTNFMWDKYNLSHLGIMRNIRQVSAELQAKYRALMENYFKFVDLQIEYEEHLSKQQLIEKEDLFAKRRYINERKKLEFKLADSKIMIKGALKDFSHLYERYNELMEVINYDLSEENVEKLESKYWIRRLFDQSLRDLRQSGIITTGNQEALRQIGLSPEQVMKEIRSFIEENKIKGITVKEENEFFNKMANKYETHVREYRMYKEFLDKDEFK